MAKHADSATVRGIAAVCMAMALFAINDAAVKMLSSHIGIGQIMILRGLLGGALLVVVIIQTQTTFHIRTVFQPLVLLRTLCDAGASVMFIMALAGLPVATVTALIQLVPLLTTIAGKLVFHDSVSRRQVTALIVGFVGVIAVIQPTSFQGGAHIFCGLGAVFLLATRDVATRLADQQLSSLVLAAFATFAIPLVSLPQLALEGWVPLTVTEAALIAGTALLVAVGNFMMVVAVRPASLSAIAPFRYSAIIFAVIAGVLILREFPTMMALGGCGLIVTGGLLVSPRAGK